MAVGMTRTEIQELYKTKNIRQIAEMLNTSYHKTREIFEFYKIKRRLRGNPAGVPHRIKKYIKLNNNK